MPSNLAFATSLVYICLASFSDCLTTNLFFYEEVTNFGAFFRPFSYPPPPASAQTEGGSRLGVNLVQDGDFSASDHSNWNCTGNGEGRASFTTDSDASHGTVWGECYKDGDNECTSSTLSQTIDISDVISDVISGEGRYEATFSVDVKDDGTAEYCQGVWMTVAAVAVVSTLSEGDDDVPPVQEFSTVYTSSNDGVNTSGWQTYRSTFPLPPNAGEVELALIPRCDSSGETDGESGECRATTVFDNVSLVIRKVETDNGKPNAASRVVAPTATPGAAYDLGGRRQTGGGRGLGVNDGKLTLRK